MNSALANFLKKISAASLLLLACQLLLLLAIRLVTHYLPGGGYGQYGLALSFSVYSSQFIQWGMDPYLSARFARGTAAESQRLLGVLLRQRQLGAILVLAAAAVTASLWQPSSQRELIFLGAVHGIALGFTMPPLFDARGSMVTWQFFAFLRHAAYVAGVLALAFFFPRYFSPAAIVSIQALCIILEVVLEQLWIQKNYGLPAWPVPARETLPLWRDTAPMAVALLAQQLLLFGGPPALHGFGRDSQLDGLTLSNQIAIAAASFFVAPTALLHVRLAQLLPDSSTFRRLAWRYTALCALAGAALALLLSVSSNLIVRLISHNKIPDAPAVLAIDAWRLAPMLAAAPLSSALICRNRLKAFAAGHGLALLAGAAVAVVYIPRFGAQAAAGAVAAGRVVFFLCCVIFFAADTSASRSERMA